MKSYLKLDVINNEQMQVLSMSMWCMPDNFLWFGSIKIVTWSEINPFYEKKKKYLQPCILHTNSWDLSGKSECSA